MSTMRAPRTSSPSPTMWPSMIASRRSGEYKIVPSDASNGNTRPGSGAGLARLAASAGGSSRDCRAPRHARRNRRVQDRRQLDDRPLGRRCRRCPAGRAERGTIGGGAIGGLFAAIDEGDAVVTARGGVTTGGFVTTAGLPATTDGFAIGADGGVTSSGLVETVGFTAATGDSVTYGLRRRVHHRRFRHGGRPGCQDRRLRRP